MPTNHAASASTTTIRSTVVAGVATNRQLRPPSLSLIEAGLAGVPSVATRVGSVPEVVQDGITGLLATTDVADLTGCTVRLLRDAGLRRRMGRAPYAFTTKQFRAGRLVADTERLYASIAVEHGWWPHQREEAEQ